MRYIYNVILLCSLFYAPLSAQITFNKVYASELTGEGCEFEITPQHFGSAIAEVADGYLVLSNTTSSTFCGWMVFSIWKMDFEGNVLWEKQYGKEEYWYNGAFNGRMIQTQDGNFVVPGWLEQTDKATRGLILKFDQAGDTLWLKTYGGVNDCQVRNITELPNGDLMGVGDTKNLGDDNPTQKNPNVWLIKTTANGEMIWEKGLDGPLVETGQYVYPTQDGGLAIGGYKGNGLFTHDTFYYKTDGEGNIEWQGEVADPDIDNCFGPLIPTTDGGYYLASCGDTILVSEFGHERPARFLEKLDKDGNREWQTFLSLEHGTGMAAIKKLPNDYVLIAGSWFDKFWQGLEPYGLITYISPQGEIIWQRAIKYHDIFNLSTDVLPTSDGGFLMTGYSWNPDRQKQDLWLVKLDENGCLSDEVCDSLFTDIEVFDPSELSPPTLFPNPTKSHLQIKIPTHFTSKPLQIQLTNIEGQAVLKEWIEDGTQLDIADLAAGIYIATWLQDGQALKREKVVVLD